MFIPSLFDENPERIPNIVLQFSRLSYRNRYIILSKIFEDEAKSKEEMDFRAKLVTALREANCYPIQKYAIKEDDEKTPK